MPQAKLWSAWSNACSLVRKGQDEQALTAIDGMISDFKGDPGLADAVQWIGRESEWTKGSIRDSNARYNMPASIYQKLTKVTDWQQAEWNDKRMAHRTKILTLMDKGDEKEIDSAIEQMAIDLAGRPELPNELYWVAVWYEEHRKPEKAQAMYERMAIEFPDSNEGKESVHHALRVAIQIEEKTGVEGTAQEIIERWKEQLKGTPRLVSVLYLAGNAYYAQAIICERFKGDTAKANIYRAKAANIFSEVISLTGDSTLTAGDCSLVANCYRKSGKLSEAIRYYKMVTEKWPGSSSEADCLEGIYGCYEELVKQGQISQGQADANLEPAYKGLVAKFPDRLDTPQTLLKLGWLNFRQNKWQEAIFYFETSLAKLPDNSKPKDALYALGRMYEKTRDKPKAIEIYRQLVSLLGDTSPEGQKAKMRIMLLENK